ncbi:MAG: ThuA domain-containing protein [Fibrobacteres bacterium]|jgi:hypothetical protein|nr:ThuA domain-containing protein [Fibrobacterota bacterium]
MMRYTLNPIPYVVLAALALGSGHARTYQLKKILVINATGSGGYMHASQIKFTDDYFKSYLGPKYGFESRSANTQAQIDSVLRDDSLKTYDVVVFNGGSRIGGFGAVGDTGAQHAFQRWIKAGGGCFAIHDFTDHNNTWPWLRDSLLNRTIFTQWSAWGADHHTMVQWDTLETDGAVRARKPEYDSIRACFPKTRFTYPDGWSSFSPDVRPIADILMTIDENTYAVPQGSAMGIGHPIMWAYPLPPDSLGNQGRFIYNARGHDLGAWDGTSSNHAPMTVGEGAIQEGETVFSDTSHTLMTKGSLWPCLQWAAGLRINAVSVHVRDASSPGLMQSRNSHGVLNVRVQGPGGHDVQVFTLAGKSVAHRSGRGDAEYSFANLRRPGIYFVEVKSSRKTYTQRIML